MKSLLILLIFSSSLCCFAQPADSLIHSVPRPRNFYLGYSASTLNPIGFMVGVERLFYNSGLYFSTNFDGHFFDSPTYDVNMQERGNLVRKHFPQGDKIVFNREEYRSFAYQINLGVHTQLHPHLGFFYGMGYGVFMRFFTMKVLPRDTPEQPLSYTVFDSNLQARGLSLEYGLSARYARLICFAGVSSIDFEKYAFKLNLGILW